MRVLPEVTGGAEHDIDAVDTGLERQLRVIQMAARVSEHLGAQVEIRHPFTVGPATAAGRGRGQLQVLDAEGVQQARDLHLLVTVEEGIGELLAFAQSRLDDGWMGGHGGFLRYRKAGASLNWMAGRERSLRRSLGGRHPVL